MVRKLHFYDQTRVRTQTEPFGPEPWVQVKVQQIPEPNLAVQVQVQARMARTWTGPDCGQSTVHMYLCTFQCAHLGKMYTHIKKSSSSNVITYNQYGCIYQFGPESTDEPRVHLLWPIQSSARVTLLPCCLHCQCGSLWVPSPSYKNSG